MKDETCGIAIEEFVGLKPKMCSFLVDNSDLKKQKAWIKMLFQQQVMINIKTFCWIINAWDTQWIEFKVMTIV